MREMSIQGPNGARRIADNEPPFVIAEIGSNHGGDMIKAKKLIAAAAFCEVDAVKFQKRDNRSLFTPAFYASAYTSEHAFGATYGEHREALELNREQYLELQGVASSLGLIFFATPFDIPSARFLADINVPCYKVASGDLRNIPLIRHLDSYGKPLIVSTGGGTLQDVDRVVRTVKSPLAILQCTAAYPVNVSEMNLRVIETYRAQYPQHVIGLSDHQNGIAMAPVAVGLGASIIEKHFTLDRSWKGGDNVFSLELEGMRRLVRDCRRVGPALGDGVKRIYESERAPLLKMAKSPYVREVRPGEPPMLELRTPAVGVDAWKIDKLRGRRAPGLETGQVIDTTGVFE